MKVIWVSETEYTDRSPLFTFTDEERAILISALRQTAETDKSTIVARMLNTIDQIDRTIFAQAGLTIGELQ